MITFGPVPARRLDQGLGINNFPPKACSYPCVCCQVGPTRNPEVGPRAFHSPADIRRSGSDQLETVRQRGWQVDWLTVVPDGEPTLNGRLYGA
jgi:wyosine [tRNA(Phe)-imidazoG37] synthetase (radical SAM superfamily)